MSDAADKPLALDAYEALADTYAALVDTKPHNAFYERPATLSLLPAVSGKRVLDAGCGPGVYTEWLVRGGAEVIAADASSRMVQLARERVGARADIRQASLDEPLDFLADASFDIVLSALVLDYVRDWPAVFREFHRVLGAGGCLVFSVGHPFADFMRHIEGNYFETELVVEMWKGFGGRVPMPVYRRPLGALVNSLLDAGFLLEKIVEPTPTEEFERADPRHYAELSRQPGFLCVRAQKP
ncbi:MAG TPA: class I SAM-dependent methyltransferase [Pyrinomonadaceae bacterium]|jgi:SAM-dependent methyltransferase|nr:class I SAM-dependent methyltransferase [Pyrinomonadaceae bacterium]